VLRHIGVWRARRNLSVSFLRVDCRAAQCQHRERMRETGTERRDAAVSTMPAQQRHSSFITVNPVRQCARRGSELGVTQASPLFSDHAPREVHLWQ
jgi:hypothetical protein